MRPTIRNKGRVKAVSYDWERECRDIFGGRDDVCVNANGRMIESKEKQGNKRLSHTLHTRCRARPGFHRVTRAAPRRESMCVAAAAIGGSLSYIMLESKRLLSLEADLSNRETVSLTLVAKIVRPVVHKRQQVDLARAQLEHHLAVRVALSAAVLQ
jgi:hypothetical protein